MTRGEFARSILMAQRIREESFDENTNRYNLTCSEAARRAVMHEAHSEDWITPVALLIRLAWNDIEIWAETNKLGMGRRTVRRKLVRSR